MDGKIKKVRLHLTIDKKVYQHLLEKSQSDYMRVATWTTQFLLKALSDKNKPDCLTYKKNDIQ